MEETIIKIELISSKNCGYINSPVLRKLPGNREINQDHVSKIKKAMLAGKNFPPLEVTTELYIIDGQHRYEAATQLWKEGKEYNLLIHVYKTETPFLDAINFNNTQLSWTLRDYIYAYAEDGNINYKKLIEWAENTLDDRMRNPKDKSTYLWDTICTLFGSSTTKVKKGEFVFQYPQYVEEVINELLAFKDRRMLLRAYARTWTIFRDNWPVINFEAYLEKWKRGFIYPDRQVIEDIYDAFERCLL